MTPVRPGVCEQHADRELRHAEAAARRDLADRLDGLQVALEARSRVILVRAPPVVWREGLVRLPRSEQQAAEERRVGNGADAVRCAPRQHVVLHRGTEDAERRLIGVQRDAGRLPLLELRHREIRHADRADLAGLEQGLAGCRRFGDRFGRRPVQLVEVDAARRRAGAGWRRTPRPPPPPTPSAPARRCRCRGRTSRRSAAAATTAAP